MWRLLPIFALLCLGCSDEHEEDLPFKRIEGIEAPLEGSFFRAGDIRDENIGSFLNQTGLSVRDIASKDALVWYRDLSIRESSYDDYCMAFQFSCDISVLNGQLEKMKKSDRFSSYWPEDAEQELGARGEQSYGATVFSQKTSQCHHFGLNDGAIRIWIDPHSKCLYYHFIDN